MFDPKDIYGNVDIQKCLGPGVSYELQFKEWPCTELAYVRIFSLDDPKEQRYVLIAPGCTADGIAETLRAAANGIRGGGARGL